MILQSQTHLPRHMPFRILFENSSILPLHLAIGAAQAAERMGEGQIDIGVKAGRTQSSQVPRARATFG